MCSLQKAEENKSHIVDLGIDRCKNNLRNKFPGKILICSKENIYVHTF